jgi:hypothetical protein
MNGDNQWTNTGGASDILTTTAIANPTYNIYGDGIPVWWQQSDLEAFANTGASTSTPGQTSTQTSSRTATQIPTKSPSSSPSPTSAAKPGLSAGTKIGLGVGIPLVAIVAGFVAAFIWFRGRSTQSSGQMKLPEPMSTSPALYGNGNGLRSPSELSSEGLYDSHHPRGRYELPTYIKRSELDTR